MITRGAAGHALAFDERNRPAWIPLAPFYAREPWRTLCGAETQSRRSAGRSAERRPAESAICGDQHGRAPSSGRTGTGALTVPPASSFQLPVDPRPCRLVARVRDSVAARPPDPCPGRRPLLADSVTSLDG